MTSPTDIQPAKLPTAIRGYLAAQTARDTDAALRAFAPTAVVVDQDQTFRGTDEILVFLREAGAEFTYTTELISASRVDDARWVATNHLEGDFPGGVADLDYRFTMNGDLIAKLVIAPDDRRRREPVHPGSFATADGGTASDLYIQQDKFREFFAAAVGSRR